MLVVSSTHPRVGTMYKGISRFLTRLKIEVANFSNFLRFRKRKQIGVERSRVPPWYERLTTTAQRERAIRIPIPVEEDRRPEIPFEREHRLALWIGESNHAGHVFVRE